MAQIFSLEKVANGDKLEQARLLYSLAPRKFSALSAQQGALIEDLEDVNQLIKDIEAGQSNVNLTKLFRALPIGAHDLKNAGRNGIKLI